MYSPKGLTKKQVEIRDSILLDFNTFIKVIAPYLQLGACHEEAAKFISNPEATHKLLIFPRGHLKSKLLALYASWRICKNPAITILSASATAALAEAQLSDIKRIIESPIAKKLFPELLMGTNEGQRERWSQIAFNVEHPIRKEIGVRDNTVAAAGAGKNIVGLHYDLLLWDDITAPDTDVDPWTKGGRDKCNRWASLAASVLNPGGEICAVGTRYHPKDVYHSLMEMNVPILDDDENVVDSKMVYQVIEEVVERDGEFLWPRKQAKDGRYYGFNSKVLAGIKAQYIDESQYYAQYYNDPTDPSNRKIDPTNFQYYDRKALSFVDGWILGSRHLQVYAAMDIAASIEKRADFTSLVVVGVDDNGFRYILDIVRLKTDKISVMSDALLNKYMKWRFKKLRIETNATQGLVANQLQDNMRRASAIFSWDKQPSRKNKHDRIMSMLEPMYSTQSIFHYKGGNTELLEDELVATKSPHDDISDALAACMEIIPMQVRRRSKKNTNNKIIYNKRFGGVSC